MINKAKGCMSAIFDGSISIGMIKHGLDTVFKKETPVEPDVGYITNGLEALFSGEDGYFEGAWVDRINGHTFTPVSASTAPVYDETNKLYNVNSFGGMLADFKTTSNATFSIEVVVRDIKNVGRNGSNYGVILGTNMNGWSFTNGPAIFKRANGECALALLKGTSMNSIAIADSNLVSGALDTIAIIPSVGYFRNGVKIGDAPSEVTVADLALFTHYDQKANGTSTYKAKGKIHGVRYYNRLLSVEEVLHNYNEDLKIYGN